MALSTSRNRGLFGLALLLGGTALGTGAAFAQATQAQNQPSRDATQGTALQEVVVTAQKRSENIQDVPATVSVVGSQLLNQFHVTQLADIGAYVPGLQVDSGGTPGQTQLSIRGIAPLSSNATVGTYIDETPIGATSLHDRGAAYALDILPYDVERIEVLEGPQGTLYGANALGGLVKYVLTTPNLNKTDIRFGGDLEGISGGSDAGGGARFMINTPLVEDKLGFIASYAFENTPGYVDNVQTGRQDQNAAKEESARLALLWKPITDLSVRLGMLYQHISADGNATVALDPDTLKPIVGELKDNNYLPNVFKSELRYDTADVNWDLHWARLVSATSYSYQKDIIDAEATRTYQPILALLGAPDGETSFPLQLTTKKFTQELRLSSPSTNRLEWLVGGFYDKEIGTNHQALTAQNPDGTSITGLDPLFVGSLPTSYEEYAAFGNVTYHFTDWFDLSGGVRYAHNNQGFREIILPGSPIIPASDEPGRSSEGVWTYSVSPRLHITRDVMAYVRVASGYQAGGPNIAFPGVPSSVKSDTLTNYEVGLKSSFWRQRALLDISAFDLQWNNIQVTGNAPGGITYTTNGGTAESRGFEANGTLRPMAGLTLNGTATFTDAVFTQDVPEVGAANGDRLPYVPRWSGSLRADYSRPLTPEWTGHLGGGLRLVGTRYSIGPFSVDEFRTGAYDALDLDADVSNARYTVRLFVKNLTDTRAYLTDSPVQNGYTGDMVQVEGILLQPRTIGMSIDVKL